MLTVRNNTTSKQQILELKGVLSGIDAMQFRNNAAPIIAIESGQLVLDVTNVIEIDLTGFNAVVMLKKEATNRGLNFSLIASKENPIQEYIHLSKLNLPSIEKDIV